VVKRSVGQGVILDGISLLVCICAAFALHWIENPKTLQTTQKFFFFGGDNWRWAIESELPNLPGGALW
jgi:hypothetical protein